MAEGANGVPQRYTQSWGQMGFTGRARMTLVSSLLPRMFSWWWKGPDSAAGITLSLSL